MKIKLDRRLQVIYDLVRNNSKVTDVGADHGYLISKLIIDQKCLSGNCVDVNKKCLEKAQHLADKCGIYNKINFLVSDGLTDVFEGQTDDIVVAGMGSELIAKIIDNCLWLKKTNDKHIILQPMTKPWILRNYLYMNGFEILDEKVVKSKGIFYVIILAKFCGNKKNPSVIESFTGTLSSNIMPEVADYFHFLSRKFEMISQKILVQNRDEKKYKYYKNISQEILSLLT